MSESSIEFKLDDIKVLEFSLNEVLETETIDNVVEASLQLWHKFDVSREIVIISCKASVSSKETKEILGTLKIACSYVIKNLESFVEGTSHTIKLPIEIIETLNSITISTLRGLFYTYFINTKLQTAAVLPLIDPKLITPVQNSD